MRTVLSEKAERSRAELMFVWVAHKENIARQFGVDASQRGRLSAGSSTSRFRTSQP
jgi:hypothetical protein